MQFGSGELSEGETQSSLHRVRGWVSGVRKDVGRENERENTADPERQEYLNKEAAHDLFVFFSCGGEHVSQVANATNTSPETV